MIPKARPGGRPRELDMRAVVNAIFYLVASGIQWRMLPKEYPKWQSVYHYFRQWRKSGLWQRVHDILRARVREKAGRHKHPTAGCIDNQSVKMTLVPGLRGYDAGKKVTGRKRHLLVDTLGLMLGVVITAASISDPAGARLLFGRLGGFCKNLRKIWADGTYRGELLAGSPSDFVSESNLFCAQMDRKAFKSCQDAGLSSELLPGWTPVDD